MMVSFFLVISSLLGTLGYYYDKIPKRVLLSIQILVKIIILVGSFLKEKMGDVNEILEDG